MWEVHQPGVALEKVGRPKVGFGLRVGIKLEESMQVKDHLIKDKELNLGSRWKVQFNQVEFQVLCIEVVVEKYIRADLVVLNRRRCFNLIFVTKRSKSVSP
jgi:hypothetical protein